MAIGQETPEQPYRQLHMVWPTSRLSSPPPLSLSTGYAVRVAQPQDEPAFFHLMELAGFSGWDQERLGRAISSVLPNGWLLIVHTDSHTDREQLVATTMATHKPSPYHPFGGELSWVAGHPDHAGQGLGLAICAAVTQRLLSAGYERIYLQTDDWRLAAIKTYLKLGYHPFLYTADMLARWRAICDHLDWPFTPDHWPVSTEMDAVGR